MVIQNIWSLLDKNQRKKLFFLFFFNMYITLLELVSLGSIFPIIYSLNDESFLFEKYEILKKLSIFSAQLNINSTILFLIILIIIIIIKNISLALYNYLEGKFVFGTQENLSLKLFKSLILKDYSFHLSNNSADLVTRIRTDGLQLKEVLLSVQNLMQSTVFLISVFIFLLLIDPTSFLFVLISFTLFGSFFLKLTNQKISRLGKQRQAMEIDRSKKLQESFSGIREIKIFLKDKFFIDDYKKLSDRISNVYSSRDFITKLPRIFMELLIVIIISLMTILLVNGSKQGIEIIAILSVFSLAAIKALPYTSKLMSAINSIKFSDQVINYYRSKFSEKSNHNFEDNKDLNFENFDSINFENVFFSYSNNEKKIFKNLSFKIDKGDKVEIKGPTGSGKSTFIDLLIGLQKPLSGSINIDNKKFKELPIKWLKNFNYVPQSIYLFDTTIKENIILDQDSKKFNEKLFFEAIKISEIFNFINSLPKKEHTLVGELGSLLSGGQRQRIGIARALYRNSNIILFDEATNSLDINTEDKIYKNINENLPKKTFIIINHRNMNSSYTNKKFKLENFQLKKI